MYKIKFKPETPYEFMATAFALNMISEIGIIFFLTQYNKYFSPLVITFIINVLLWIGLAFVLFGIYKVYRSKDPITSQNYSLNTRIGITIIGVLLSCLYVFQKLSVYVGNGLAGN